MMPKGVEHRSSTPSSLNISDVKIPMMPKGVEHRGLVNEIEADLAVKIPMMPKGVEHSHDWTSIVRLSG